MARRKREVPQSFSVYIRGKEWVIQVMTQDDMQRVAKTLPLVAEFTDERTWRAAYGICFRSIRTIGLDPGILRTPLLETTIGHELTHALLDISGQADEYNEELIADVMGEDVWSVFRQVTENIPIEWLPG
jgi:hypothetical protein